MLEIRRGKAVRSYENSFFREFARNLSQLFDRYDMDGLLIANSECKIASHLQIDILLVTQHAVLLIDLKNFGGEIILPVADKDFADGQWITQTGDIIKGGSYINPYKQLYQQKKAFVWVYHNSSLKERIALHQDKFNPSHVKKIVCFLKPIEVKNHIPAKDEIDFFITDSQSYLELIKDILDVEDADNNLSKKSFDEFKTIYEADSFLLSEHYQDSDLTIYVNQSDSQLDYESLYPDQRLALQEISTFLQSDMDKVFILQGSRLSGKTHILPHIKEIAFKNNFTQVEFFASSVRVINNLLPKNMHFNSLYPYIYGGSALESEQPQQTTQDINHNNMENSQDDDTDEIIQNLRIVPLRKCEADSKAVLIIDEAQLISDSYHQTSDLRFGTGRLLEDLINFSELQQSNRKIIFIGDSFQISTGKIEENSLNPTHYQRKYNIEPKVIQLHDKPNTAIIEQALKLVSSIRHGFYNWIDVQKSESLNFIDKSDILSLLQNDWVDNQERKILTYTNADAQKVNLWIKKKILQNTDDIAPNDLIFFNNNFKVEDTSNPFGYTKKIYNGQFAKVELVNPMFTEQILVKGKGTITLTFREIEAYIFDSGHKVTLLSLENYRESEKGELSSDEEIALKILQNIKLKKEIEDTPFESSKLYQQFILEKQPIEKEIANLTEQLNNGARVKTKLGETQKQLKQIEKKYQKLHRIDVERILLNDSSSEFYKYKNYALIRFGWALTVHKAVTYQWQEVLFNVNQGDNAGKSNESYFRWLYTGLTRATNKITLVNYESISPFSKVHFTDQHSHNANKQYFLVVDQDANIDHNLILDYSRRFDYKHDDFINILVQIYQLIKNKIDGQDINIHTVSHTNYQAMYEFKNQANNIAKISIYYDKKGHVKPPKLIKCDDDVFANEVLSCLTAKNTIKNFDFITDGWRKNLYQKLFHQLKNHSYEINQIIQESYKDTVTLYRDDDILIVDMHYNGGGFFSSIIAKFYEKQHIWECFKKIIQSKYGQIKWQGKEKNLPVA